MRMNERRTALVFRRCCCWFDLFGGRDIDVVVVVVVGGFTLTEHKPIMCVCVCQYKPPTPFDV